MERAAFLFPFFAIPTHSSIVKAIRSILLFSYLFLSLCLVALAGDTTAAAPPKITATDAANHYGETLMVCGKVVQVTERPKVVFINLDERFPNSPFTGVIFSTNMNAFTNLSELKGKNVAITGKIKEYHDKPEIILTNVSQLKVTPGDKAK